MAKLIFFVVFIFIISGVSSVLVDKYFFPWIATSSALSKYKFFKKGMENVMVINKTEQVTVSENQDISGYIGKSSSSVVEITMSGKSSQDQLGQSVSGVVVSADGLVASYGDKFFGSKDAAYKIFIQDGKSFDAKVVLSDSFSNLVLLKIDGAENLPVAEFIAPEDIKVGIKTAVIGRSGFNAEISLGLGLASEWAKSYSIGGNLASSEKLQGVLFVDPSAAGNEWSDNMKGGAAVDYNGNVIGLVGGRKEISGSKFFIVPVNHLQYVIDQYLREGSVKRANLGVYYIALSRETAYLAENNFDRGALIFTPGGQQGLAVIVGSSADKAGIKVGDIILSVNGDEVNPDQNLAYLISKYHPGDEVTLKLVRDGKDMELKAVLQ
ncbi:MAG: PDZ domain-containing protein [Candidatus Moranbacteria bacterium]|nr:PDZ domain-containing protein [Candidatus Moranbacteria bacterium]